MTLRAFLVALLISLTVTLTVAAIAAAVVRFFVPDATGPTWIAAWFGGAIAVGFIVALVLTVRRAATPFDAAREIDGRLELRERVASAISLDEGTRASDVGRALVDDASRRIDGLDLAAPFSVSVGRHWLLPIVPAGLLAVAMGLPATEQPVDAALVDEQAKKQWDRAKKPLEKDLKNARQEAEKSNLKDAAKLIASLESKLASPEPPKTERALVALNNLADELRSRQQKLANPDQLRRQMGSLAKNEGAGSELAKAMKAGDFDRAQQALARMKSQLESSELSAEERTKLEKQIEALERALERLKEQKLQKQEALAQQMQGRQNGEQLQQGESQDGDMNSGDLPGGLDDLLPGGEQLKDAPSGLTTKPRAGDLGERIDELMEGLEGLELECAEHELLEGAIERIAAARRAMLCEGCEGEGCTACQGEGGKMAGRLAGRARAAAGKSDQLGKPGDGPTGAAVGGFGDRPETPTDTKSVNARVKANVGKGQSVVVGEADGPNRRGASGQNIRGAAEPQEEREADPLAEQRLPRRERDHLREYFDSLRGVKK
jgi:hypothetical protein